MASKTGSRVAISVSDGDSRGYKGEIMKVLPICFLLAAITGCAQPSTIVSKVYPPSDPASVEILFAQPSRDHEQIAMISVHGVGGGSYANNTKLALDKLKQEAGKVGAERWPQNSGQRDKWTICS